MVPEASAFGLWSGRGGGLDPSASAAFGAPTRRWGIGPLDKNDGGRGVRIGVPTEGATVSDDGDDDE